MVKRFFNKIRFSVGSQINFLFVLILLAFVGFGIYNYFLLTQLNNRYIRETDQYSEIIGLKKDFQDCDKRLMEYVKTGNRTALAELNDLYETVAQRINGLYYSVSDQEAKYLLKSIKNSFQSYYQECSNAAYLYNMKNYDYFSSVNGSSSIILYLDSYTDDLLEYTLNMSIETMEQVKAKQAGSILRNAAIAVMACVTIAGINVYIRYVMTHPIYILSEQDREIASGNLDVKPNNIELSNDMGLLARTFNLMCESIRNKIQAEKSLLMEQKKNIEVEKLLEEARFIALQTQTNPHFLFNTLNSINRTILFGRNEQALMMLDSLAELLRYNLTDGNIPTELGQEIAITEKYLNIQKLRFSDHIHVREQIDAELLNLVKLPKFTLQPVVENAIIHGLEPKTEGGTIVIQIRKKGSHALIRIMDNGVGMDYERLRSIRAGFGESRSKRIGIWNTCQRIRHFTGEENSFCIFSKKGKGTLVVIQIPWGQKEE